MDDEVVKVDLKIASNSNLIAAQKRIEEEINRREKQVDYSLVRTQLRHIHHELKYTDEQIGGLPRLSIEHLELYLNFLQRCLPDSPALTSTHTSTAPPTPSSSSSSSSTSTSTPTSCSTPTSTPTSTPASTPTSTPTAITDDHTHAHTHTHGDDLMRLRTLQHSLLEQVSAKLLAHPLAHKPRSGDRADAEGLGSTYSVVKVPMYRRRQTFVMLYCSIIAGPPLIFGTLFCLWYLFRSYFTYLFLAYFAYVLYDNKTRPLPCPSRISQLWRHSTFYELFRDYFPIRLVKAHPTADFSPSRNYLFCYHPHGVQSAGAFSMASAPTGFDELFPGLTASLQTLSVNFFIPMTRENLIALGVGDASRSCLIRTLTQHPGSSAVLVTGGALESMFAHPYDAKVVLKTRTGFVKVAMNSGACLVPVWGFGENNIYSNLAKGSPSLQRWQRKIQQIISFAPLLVAGRGVFTYTFGLLPHRRPITVVVGDPIPTGPADPNPTPQKITEIHEKYKQALLDLYNTYKDIYDPKAKSLEFI